MKDEFLRSYKQKKGEQQGMVRRILYTKMFIDAHNYLFPDGWTLFMLWPGFLTLKAPEGIQLPEFVKVADRIAKKFRQEPDKEIDKNNVRFTFKVWFGEYSKTWTNRAGYNNLQSVYLELTTKNTEECEITYKRKMHKVPVLTGYCKEIAEQKHLK